MKQTEQTNEEIFRKIDEAVERLRIPFGILFTQWMLDEVRRGTDPGTIVCAFTSSIAAATSTIIENLIKPEGHAPTVEMAAKVFRSDLVSMTPAAQERPEEPAVH